MFGGKHDETDWSKDYQSSSLKGLLFLHDVITLKNPNVKLIIYSTDRSEFIDYWDSKDNLHPFGAAVAGDHAQGHTPDR